MEKQRNTIAFLTDKLEFPKVEEASSEGLLAVGGDLSPDRLMLAYSRGIFPWFNEDSLILWWSPDPRMVLYPQKIRISKSMKKIMRAGKFKLTINQCFDEVIDQCAYISRKDQDGTWITKAMKDAYKKLHEKGHCISYEVWEENNLVGGLYGVDLGHVFCGESMFSKVSNASKFALVRLANDLAEKNYSLIDCQLHTEHLLSLGAEEISREEYMKILKSQI